MLPKQIVPIIWKCVLLQTEKFLDEKQPKAVEVPAKLLYNVLSYRITREFAKVTHYKTERRMFYVKTYFKHLALSHNDDRLIACFHLCGEVRLPLLHRQKSEARIQRLYAAISVPRRQVGRKKDAHCTPIKFVPQQGGLDYRYFKHMEVSQ